MKKHIKENVVEFVHQIEVHRGVHFETVTETMIRAQEVVEETPLGKVAEELVLMWLELHE